MRTVRLLDGASVPAIGQGTWMMGENPNRRAEEIATLQEGVDRGASLIDTATPFFWSRRSIPGMPRAPA